MPTGNDYKNNDFIVIKTNVGLILSAFFFYIQRSTVNSKQLPKLECVILKNKLYYIYKYIYII